MAGRTPASYSRTEPSRFCCLARAQKVGQALQFVYATKVPRKNRQMKSRLQGFFVVVIVTPTSIARRPQLYTAPLWSWGASMGQGKGDPKLRNTRARYGPRTKEAEALAHALHTIHVFLGTVAHVQHHVCGDACWDACMALGAARVYTHELKPHD